MTNREESSALSTSFGPRAALLPLVVLWLVAVVARLGGPWPLGAAYGTLQGCTLTAVALPIFAVVAWRVGVRAAAVAAAATALILAMTTTLESMPDKSTFGTAGHVAAGLAALVGIAWFTRHGSWRDYGLGIDLAHKATRRSLIAITAFIVFLVALQLVLLTTHVVTPQDIGFPAAPFIEAAAFQFFIVAVDEELVWRGLLQTHVDRLVPGRVRLLGAELGAGAAVSFALFSAAHMIHVKLDPSLGVDVHFHGAFFLAAVKVYLRALTKSVWPPVVMHGLWNGQNVVMHAVAAAW